MGKRREKLILPAPLLYSREVTAALLGRINIASVRRMEEDGLLTPIRPTGKPTSAVFYSAKQVCAIAGCDPADVVLQLQQLPTAKPKLLPPIQRKRLGGG